MEHRPSRLAKLTRPRLARAVARERLFAMLDHAHSQGSAVWVVGPPGAGKTALIASWLDARQGQGIWYQVDKGDTDLPTFFHYLRQAGAAFARRRQKPLPALTPEYLHDVSGFSRRFFRELFMRMPERSVLVFDNLHEAASAGLFLQIVADAIGEAPVGLMIAIASRSEASEHYARHIASERVTRLDWSALKLTVDEAEAIARQRGYSRSEPVMALHASCAGWAAGFTLLIERLNRSEATGAVGPTDSLREVFDYFAGQLFDAASPDSQRRLVLLSFLPVMRESAVRQFAGDEVVGLLADLHRRHLFTDRRSAGEPVYQFHSLFHAFLQHRALASLTLPEQIDCTRRAARTLETTGQAEDALPLYLRVGDADTARSIILREAPGLLGQGRWRSIVDWIAALPDSIAASDCWLAYWLGAAQIVVEPPAARRELERAFALANRAEDHLCALRSAAGIVQTYMLQYADFRPLDPWIEALETGLARRIAFPDSNSELQVQAALLIALAYRRPASATLPACVERVFELVDGEADVNLRLTGAAYLLAYSSTTGPLVLGRRARPILDVLLSRDDVSPLTASWAWFIVAHYSRLCGYDDEGRAAIARLEAIAEEEGLPHAHLLACIMGSWQEMAGPNLAAAERWIERLQAAVDPRHPYDVASIHSTRMELAYLRSDAETALREGRAAIEFFDRSGTAMHRLLNRDILTGALLALGRIHEVRPVLAEWRRISGGVRHIWLEARVRSTEALVLLADGEREAGCQALAEAFQSVRHQGTMHTLSWKRPMMIQAASEALKAGIEVPFVQQLIRQLRWSPPAQATEAWPWPVKIYSLGRFQILVNDQPLSFGRKVPRKPFTLLKAIVALGAREVRDQRLIDALWPQESGDAAHEAFHQALLRLRRLLVTAQAVQLIEGRVSLDESLVWTDVRAFEALAAGDPAHASAAVELYRGDFLADESEQPWTASLRERLRGKFIHLVATAGQTFERAARWDEALASYERGLDADPLAESFYQGIMRCHTACDRRAEALSAYRRLRHQLSIVLGMQPSSSSQALARELLTR